MSATLSDPLLHETAMTMTYDVCSHYNIWYAHAIVFGKGRCVNGMAPPQRGCPHLNPGRVIDIKSVEKKICSDGIDNSLVAICGNHAGRPQVLRAKNGQHSSSCAKFKQSLPGYKRSASLGREMRPE